MNDWVEHVIWWHAHPLTFLGAERAALPPDAAPVPRLRRFAPWLDYLVELGCNGLALGPVFAAETHGYDTVDHYRVDPRLGTTDDLRWLLDECRRRGIRVLFDGVFNHVGRGFGPFRDVLDRGRDSAYANWFRLSYNDDGGFDHADFEGHHHLVALNHDEPAVVDYVAGVMRHWREFGADGWRLDAAYAVPLPFWRATAGSIDGGWFVGEVIHGDYPAFVRDGGLDSVTQYELWKAIRSSLNDLNFFELAWALERHDAFGADFPPLTFVGNHDVTRIASALTEPRHLGLALAVLFTVGGVPSVYAGDEQAFTGVKRDIEFGDDEIRPAFPATPADLAPFGEPTFHLHQQLISLRRRFPWLHRATTKPLHLTNKQLAYEVSAGPDRLIVLLNAADHGHDFPLDLGPARVVESSGGTGTLVPGPGWSILRG
ncbi:alpha-amylase [Actinoplanes sp. SE50]|uniref:alpha-amylase family glycosyl hydrolase n=1 Tax=unclassified Actinoplanes TaxID=2626549 RepID=UPI00023EC9AD|nr:MULTISPECIES: alpha-amylase family glycosyl hydrolase [unclassified Actinoplanes]AEV85391.1 alpha amylase, catalytic region [Actinoplanes sp. SE50/110]ATO83786.1 alpha-amylase [Actinoplanes sp. SE50]SLM01194.1 alpha-amylase [Actinoplanes sp. SE50/110]